MKCTVINCHSVYDGKGCECSFFRFPSDAATRKKWILFSGQRKESITKNSYICMHHFKSEDFANNMQYELGFAKQRQLKQGAVPSINTASPENVEMYKKRAERIKKREQKKLVESLLKQHNSVTESVKVVDTLQELEVPFEALEYLDWDPLIEVAEGVDEPQILEVPFEASECLDGVDAPQIFEVPSDVSECLEEVNEESISPELETSDDHNDKLKSELERLRMENTILRKQNRMNVSKLRKIEKQLDNVRSIHEYDMENREK